MPSRRDFNRWPLPPRAEHLPLERGIPHGGLSAERRTEWSDQMLFMLLDHPYRHELPTVLATNVALSDLEAHIASRLQDVDLSTVQVMEGPDFRRTSRH